MTKKSKFVFTFDIDTVLLKLIVKYRQDIYSRGSTCKGWNLILDEFNSILNSSIVQSRTLNNRFKVLRKDLNLRISNDLVKSVGLNENEKILVFLNSFFSSKSGKLAEKEKEKGLLIDGKKLDINLDSIDYEDVPIDDLNHEIESEISNEMNNEMNNNIIDDVNAGQSHQDTQSHQSNQDQEDDHDNHDNQTENGSNESRNNSNSSMSPKTNRRGSYQMLQLQYNQMELNNMIPQNQLSMQNQLPQNVYPMYHHSPNSSISSQIIPDQMSPNYHEIDKDNMNMAMNNGFEMYSPKQNLDYYYYETKNRKKEPYRAKRTKPNPSMNSPNLNREFNRPSPNLPHNRPPNQPQYTPNQTQFRRSPHLGQPNGQLNGQPNGQSNGQPINRQNGQQNGQQGQQTNQPNNQQSTQQMQQNTQQNNQQTNQQVNGQLQNNNQMQNNHQNTHQSEKLSNQAQLINDLQQTQAKQNQELNEFRKEFFDFKYQVGSRLDQILQSLQKN
ncbi:hypothetical protein CLIB1444_01S20230 [[Candida] jaroonii]|uniref:Uncharacterized protein n=1 Tax=[Candida] jaroonii TaxID=467808 RepID=A0ACA9Y260_9ASCO|nr:hypothetical protein CLIB1444_01S20230 [[Candida] jaroonii]